MAQDLSVTFLYEKEGIARYWFIANVPGRSTEELKFSLTANGTWASSSNAFSKLEPDIRTQCINLAREQIPN